MAEHEVRRILRALRKEDALGRRRGDTEALHRWIAELRARASRSGPVLVREEGVFEAAEVREAVERFERLRR